MQPESIHGLQKQTKTMTRRIVKPSESKPKVSPLEMYPWIIDGELQKDKNGCPCWIGTHPDYPTGQKWFSSPYGMPGDILWVKETWGKFIREHVIDKKYFYKADATAEGEKHRMDYVRAGYPYKYKPSIYMPKAACRWFLEITDIRVERLQDITEEDAVAEGIDIKQWMHLPCEDPCKSGYSYLWEQINGKDSWETNPWVWVISFKQIPKPHFFN